MHSATLYKVKIISTGVARSTHKPRALESALYERFELLESELELE